MTFPELYSVLQHHGVSLSDHQKEQVESFYLLLMKANKTVNLISRKETEIISRHFLNSALIRCLKNFDSGIKVLDIGSGGGFPGILMSILYPAASFTLVESIRKKSEFLEKVILEIGLSNSSVKRDRVEKITGQFDFITCRAVAGIDQVVLWSSHLLRPGGKWLLWKGRNFRDEAGLEGIVVHDLARYHPSQNGVILCLKK